MLRTILTVICLVTMSSSFAINCLAEEAIKEKNPEVGDTVELEDGLKYTLLKTGNGEVCKSGQVLKVHYTGTLEDGTKFDSSLDRKQPLEVTIGAGDVIKGWDKGIPGMKVGEKRKLVIPSALAYGEKGIGVIPPNSTLIFEVELLEIKQ